MKASILVLEDEPPIQELIVINFARAGYEVFRAADCDAAQELLRISIPSLAVVDWMLPGKSGIDFIKMLRSDSTTRDLPVIMLTARSDERDKILAFECGADDYITKPFSPRELLARANVLLRRLAPHLTTNMVAIGRLQIDPIKHRVVAGNTPVALSPTEFRLLHYLMCHPGRVHNRKQLLDKVWGINAFLDERTVDAHIGRLRGALQDAGCQEYIETVRGVGYRLAEPALEIST